MTIAAEAIDRLHTTASSHHRVMVVELMGHNAGWLALGAGVASGADVILIPEIPYSRDIVAASLMDRVRGGKRFSIVAVAEGATPREPKSDAKKDSGKKAKAKALQHVPMSARLADHLEEASGLETRVVNARPSATRRRAHADGSDALHRVRQQSRPTRAPRRVRRDGRQTRRRLRRRPAQRRRGQKTPRTARPPPHPRRPRRGHLPGG